MKIDALNGTSPSLQGETFDLPLSEIHTGANPRTTFDEEYISGLAQSIDQNGLLQPVLVRHADDGNGFVMIAGECRLRAHRLLGRATIRAEVREADAQAALLVSIVENIQRRAMDAIDLATSYLHLLESGMTAQEIAERIGKSVATITNTVRLLDLPKDVQQLIREGKLTPNHGLKLAPMRSRPGLLSSLCPDHRGAWHDGQGSGTRSLARRGAGGGGGRSACSIRR